MVPLPKGRFVALKAIWLVGINGTRAMTAFNNRTGGFQLTPVGRVQTPTLAILAEREDKIHHFKARNYYEVFGDFEVEAGTYRGRLVSRRFHQRWRRRRARRADLGQATADEIKSRCVGKTGVATEERKPTTQAPPLLYDLTSLQRDANARGFSAKRTLQIAAAALRALQSYHLSADRFRYLPEDYIPTVKSTLSRIENPHARTVLDENWVKPSKRIFNTPRFRITSPSSRPEQRRTDSMKCSRRFTI